MYLRGQQQHATVSSFSSEDAYINHRVVHHFVDAAYLILSEKLLKKINTSIMTWNHDLAHGK